MDQLVYSYLYTTETTWRSLLGQVTDSGVQLNLLLRKKEKRMESYRSLLCLKLGNVPPSGIRRMPAAKNSSIQTATLLCTHYLLTHTTSTTSISHLPHKGTAKL
jgi:hypothetical protein